MAPCMSKLAFRDDLFQTLTTILPAGGDDGKTGDMNGISIVMTVASVISVIIILATLSQRYTPSGRRGIFRATLNGDEQQPHDLVTASNQPNGLHYTVDDSNQSPPPSYSRSLGQQQGSVLPSPGSPANAPPRDSTASPRAASPRVQASDSLVAGQPAALPETPPPPYGVDMPSQSSPRETSESLPPVYGSAPWSRPSSQELRDSQILLLDQTPFINPATEGQSSSQGSLPTTPPPPYSPPSDEPFDSEWFELQDPPVRPPAVVITRATSEA